MCVTLERVDESLGWQNGASVRGLSLIVANNLPFLSLAYVRTHAFAQHRHHQRPDSHVFPHFLSHTLPHFFFKHHQQSRSLGVVSPPPGLEKRHLPKHVSWRGTAADNVMKDQATCGSCWVSESE